MSFLVGRFFLFPVRGNTYLLVACTVAVLAITALYWIRSKHDQSTRDESTALLKTRVKPRLHVQKAAMRKLLKLWKSWDGYHTYKAVAELLCSLDAGALIVVYDAKRGNKLGRVLPTKDVTCLMDAFADAAPRLFEDEKGAKICSGFSAIAQAFASNHPQEGVADMFADRWAPQVLNSLAPKLMHLMTDPKKKASLQKTLDKLEGQPADGAFAVLSLRGKVVAASVTIEAVSKYDMVGPGGKAFGTRHHAGLAAVEWMKSNKLQGMAFVRSDAGSVTTIFIDDDGLIKAYQVN